VAGVSLRGINAEAGLSPAALHYHFGSKQGLVEALLERRMPALMARRAELLDALEAADASATVRCVLDAVARPLVELLAREGEVGGRYLRLICRLQADRDIDERYVVARFRSGVDRLEPLVQRALPDQSVGTVRLRLGLAIETLLRSLADWEGLAARGSSSGRGLSLDDFVDELLDFLAAGLEAPGHTVRAGSIPDAAPPPKALAGISSRGHPS